MPAKRRTYRKKSYRRRFNDKKINTAIEKKIKDIAKREDEKNIKYYIARESIMKDGEEWAENQRMPIIDSQKELDPGVVYFTALTELGGFAKAIISPEWPLNSTTPIRKMKNSKFGIKTLQVTFNIANLTFFTQTVKMAIIYIPNINEATDATANHLLPNIHMLGDVNGKYTGIFKELLKTNATYANSAKDFVIVKQKTIRLPPRPVPGHSFENSTGQTPVTLLVDAYNHVTQNRRSYRRVTLTKTYKNPKMLYYNAPNSGSIASTPLLCGNGNFFFVYATDGCPQLGQSSNAVSVCYGSSGCKFTFEGAPDNINKL